MRTRPGATPSTFRLVDDEQDVGYIDGTTVAFLGFASRTDAALAASAAHRGLVRRRENSHWSAHALDDILVMEQGSTQYVIARAGVLATLRPPLDGSDAADWGFEIDLLPEERLGVFAVSRARVMWRELRATGIHRRMRQFNTESQASVDEQGEKHGWYDRLSNYFGFGPYRRPAGGAENRASAGTAPALAGPHVRR
jgi:hypothetical protein